MLPKDICHLLAYNILIFIYSVVCPVAQSLYRLSYRAEGSRDLIPVGTRFSAVRADSGSHPVSYTIITVYFPGVEVAGACCWPPIPSTAEGPRKVKSYTSTDPKELRGLQKGENLPIDPVTFNNVDPTANTSLSAVYFPCINSKL